MGMNDDLMGGSLDPQKVSQILTTYGMSTKQIDNLRLNMCDDFKDRGYTCIDSQYVKWNEED